MGVYYSGGVVYGYHVRRDEIPEQFDSEYDFAEVVCKTVEGVGYSVSGDAYSGEYDGVVFTNNEGHNYVAADSGLSYGFTQVEPLDMTEPDVDKIVELYHTPKRNCELYTFFHVG